MLNQSILPFKQNFHWKSSRTINYYVTLKEHENFEPCEHVEIVMPLRIHTYTCNQDDNIAKPPRRSLDPTVMSRTVKCKGDIFLKLSSPKLIPYRKKKMLAKVISELNFVSRNWS